MAINFNLLDLIFLVIIAVLVIRGIVRGFVNEVMSMAAVILGLLAAVLLTKPLTQLINSLIGYSLWSQIIAFLALFVIVYFLVKVFEKAMQNGIEKMKLQRLDRVLGFFLGLIEGVIVVAVCIFILQLQLFWNVQSLINGSFISRLLLPIIDTSRQYFKIETGWNNILNYLMERHV